MARSLSAERLPFASATFSKNASKNVMRSSIRSAPSIRRAFVALSFVLGSATRRFFSSRASLLNTLKIVEIIMARADRLTSPTFVLEIKAASWRARDM